MASVEKQQPYNEKQNVPQPYNVSGEGPSHQEPTLPPYETRPPNTQHKSSGRGGRYLPTIIFAIPFPVPTHSHSAQPVSPYLLYALPRAPYQKPPKDANGNDIVKEGLVKKAERKWQEEIAEGDRIKNGLEPEAGAWKKFKGKATGTANTVIRWLPNSRIEALQRVPPTHKLGELTVFYPHDAVSPDGLPVRPEIMQYHIEEVLKKTQKSATIGAIGSAFLLPVTLAIDFFIVIPIFLFEMNMAYVASQFAGRQKVSAITQSRLPLVCTPSAYLAPVSRVLAATCYHIAPTQFASPPAAVRGLTGVSEAALLEAADALLANFSQAAPEEVLQRHILDREKIAEDLRRCCAKAAGEYVKGLK
ncbi:hypothetical protein BDW22DRAFT_1480987 [Trametopsis cervina]|nr:hypothetical protein BDW22DRAFT_1480987 [Trametopsis cervina]